MLLVAALDLDRAVVPAHGRVQVAEDAERAAGGQAAGAVVDVGLEHGPDRRPPRRQRALPVGAHLRDEDVEQALGVVEQRRDVRRRRIALEAPGELLGHPLGRRRPHALELASRSASGVLGGGEMKSARNRRRRARGRRAAASRGPPAAGAPRAPRAGAASGAAGSRSVFVLHVRSNSGEIAKRMWSRSSVVKRYVITPRTIRSAAVVKGD